MATKKVIGYRWFTFTYRKGGYRNSPLKRVLGGISKSRKTAEDNFKKAKTKLRARGLVCSGGWVQEVNKGK
jgi:hypothetical protein